GSLTRGPAPGRSPPRFCVDLTHRVRKPPHAKREAYHRNSAAPSGLGRGGSPGRRSRCPGFVFAKRQISKIKNQTNLKSTNGQIPRIMCAAHCCALDFG